MKTYLISLAAGVLVGIIYGLMHVRSPAPPTIALIGLLGMLVGEQLVPMASRLIKGEPITVNWFATECMPKITGGPSKPAAPTVMAANKHDE
jgi:XapX domain-containing protein